MKKQNILAKIAIVLLITLTIIVNAAQLSNNTAYAATTYNTDSSAPANGNIFVSISGNYLSENSKTLIDRINEIRYEACKQGVKNPETGKKLTLADYKPVVWSETLEAYARLRAAEASVNWAHTRPSNKSTFKNTVKLANGYHSAENLAMGYTLRSSLEGYYGEKSGYTRNGLTCHYSVMISPSYTLVGMAGFQQSGKQIFSAMEFGTIYNNKSNSNSTKQTALNATVNQIVEVNVAYLVNSITLSGANTVNAGSKISLTATANMKNATKTATVTKGLTWKSSNTAIATVDANGNITGIAAGTATITATAGNKTASYKVTVNGSTVVKTNSNTTGLVKVNGSWIYVKNGTQDKAFTGLAKNEYGWFYVKNGALDRTYTGLAQNQYGWFYVKNGVLDKTYTGVASNQYGNFYVKNGSLDRTFSGKAKDANGKTYTVTNGVAK